MLEEPEKLVDGRENGWRGPEQGRRRGGYPCRSGPVELRQKLIHQAPEERAEGKIALQNHAALRSGRKEGRYRTNRIRGSTLKSSRSRVRGNAAGGSFGDGMAACRPERSRGGGWAAALVYDLENWVS